MLLQAQTAGNALKHQAAGMQTLVGFPLAKRSVSLGTNQVKVKAWPMSLMCASAVVHASAQFNWLIQGWLVACFIAAQDLL